jgi:hypothetical protein
MRQQLLPLLQDPWTAAAAAAALHQRQAAPARLPWGWQIDRQALQLLAHTKRQVATASATVAFRLSFIYAADCGIAFYVLFSNVRAD